MKKSKTPFHMGLFVCIALCLIICVGITIILQPPKYGDFVLVRNVVKFLFFIAFGIFSAVMGITMNTNDSSVLRVAFVLFGFSVIFMMVFNEGEIVKDIFAQETRQVVLKDCTYTIEEKGARYTYIAYHLCGESEEGKWKFEVTGIDTDILVKLANENVSAKVTYYSHSHLVKSVEIIEY